MRLLAPAAAAVRRRRSVLLDVAAVDTITPSTRSTNAFRRNAGASMEPIGSQNVRSGAFAHYIRVGGALVPHILAESTQTNQWGVSNIFTDAAWTKTATTVTAATSVGPDGVTTNMSSLLETATTAEHLIGRACVGLTDNVRASVLFFVKLRDATRSWVIITTTDRGGVVRRTWVNISTGAIGTKDASHVVRVGDWVGGIYAITVSFPTGSGVGAGFGQLSTSTADGTSSFLGDVTKGVYIYGAMHCGVDGWCGSYIDTPTSSTVSRGGDNILLTLPDAAASDVTVYLRRTMNGETMRAPSYDIWGIGRDATPTSPFAGEIAENGVMRYSGHLLATSDNFRFQTLVPAIGDTIETRMVVSPRIASAQWFHSVNGATEASGGASITGTAFAKWYKGNFWLGDGAFRNIIVARGAQPLDYFRGRLR